MGGRDVLPARDLAVDAGALMIAAGEKLGPRRRANRADVKAIERNAAGGERVDVRRANLAVAARAVVAPAGVVGQEHNDVRPLFRGCR